MTSEPTSTTGPARPPTADELGIPAYDGPPIVLFPVQATTPAPPPKPPRQPVTYESRGSNYFLRARVEWYGSKFTQISWQIHAYHPQPAANRCAASAFLGVEPWLLAMFKPEVASHWVAFVAAVNAKIAEMADEQ